MTNSAKNNLKVYHYIQEGGLPDRVANYLHEVYTPNEMPQVASILLQSILQICRRGFLILDLTLEDLNFKTSQTFLNFQKEAIDKLLIDFSLFNNDLVDNAIYKIITEENDLEYHQELDNCIDELNEVIIMLDFEDEYEKARNIKDIEDIDPYIAILKEDTHRINLKRQNKKIFNEGLQTLFKEQSQTLIEFLELKKEQLSSNKKIDISPIIEISRCIELHEKFSGVLWNSDISVEDFLKYWTPYNMPIKFSTRLLPDKQNGFVFLLIELGLLKGKLKTGFTQEEIAQLFGISDINKRKSDVLKRQKNTSHYNFIKEKL
ncbi:MAG TPA: hypothetical protein PKA53_06940 [Sphingobacterium sp.]|nr:hypothetical protein [Sphingobacterium sp.]